jgi:hypothetical protein
MSLTTSPARSRFKRAALVLSAGLFATTLAIGGGLAANAAPVAPSATLSAATATINGHVTLNVLGFDANEYMTISFDSTFVHSGNADANGAYTNMEFVPAEATIGNHAFTIVGDTSGTFTLPLEVVAQPTASPVTATVTASTFATTGVTITFSGFTAGESVSIGGGTGGMGGPIETVTANSNGSVVYTARASTFGTGAGAPGEYFLLAETAAGNITGLATTITVVADPAAPATPVKARASFAG